MPKYDNMIIINDKLISDFNSPPHTSIQSGVTGNKQAVSSRESNESQVTLCMLDCAHCSVPWCTILLVHQQVSVHVTFTLDEHCAAMLKFKLFAKFVGSKLSYLHPHRQSGIIIYLFCFINVLVNKCDSMPHRWNVCLYHIAFTHSYTTHTLTETAVSLKSLNFDL